MNKKLSIEISSLQTSYWTPKGTLRYFIVCINLKKLSDFGCSEMMKSTITKNQMVETLKGSVLYMAPE